jgi:hypothetical protein
LEVGAGQGRLTYHLEKTLSALYATFFEVRAIDDFNDDWENQLPIVECMDMQDAIATYKPHIIIASWLLPHPDSDSDSDITHYRRKESSVEEYLLI